MTQFLVAICHADDYDGSVETEAITHDNESIVLERELLLCDVASVLAQAFLEEAMNAVKNAGEKDTRELQLAVIKSMLAFHGHRKACEDCVAAQPTQRRVPERRNRLLDEICPAVDSPFARRL